MKSCRVNKPRLAPLDVRVLGTTGETPVPSHERTWSPLKYPRSARAVICSQPVACRALNAMGASWWRSYPGRRRSATAKSAGGSHNMPSLNDRVLALTGKTQQEITGACRGARPNHVGAAIARHKRAGLVEERDGKLYAIQ